MVATTIRYGRAIGSPAVAGLARGLGNGAVLAIALAAVASAIPGAAWGQTWGYTGSDYGTAANWIPNGVPGSGQTATFNSAAGVQPIASQDYTIGTVNQTAGVLTVTDVDILTIETAYNISNASTAGQGWISLNSGATLTADHANLAGNLRGDGAIVITGDTKIAGLNFGTGNITISAGTLQMGNDNGSSVGSLGTGNVLNNSALTFNRTGGADVVANVISGTGTLARINIGRTILLATNTYSGVTTISAGTLQIGDGGTAGTLGTGAVVNDAALEFKRSDAVTVTNVISGTGVVSQTGIGNLLLSGNNSYSGGTTVTSGVLTLGQNTSAGSGTIALANGTTLAAGAAGLALSNAFALTGSTTVNGGAGVFTLNGDLAGTGALTSTGAGRLVLSGTSSYTGGTTIGSGTLQIGNGGNTGSIVGDVTNNAAVAFNRSDAVAFGGVISGGGNVRLIGSGRIDLTSVSTYTGATNVDAGTLAVNGSIAASSLTTVNAGGSLGGNGVVGNTFINGGTLAPGNSVGALTVQGSLTLSAAASYLVEISPSNADRVNVTGAANLGGATVNTSFAPGNYVARQYTIVEAAGGVNGAFGAASSTNLPAAFNSFLSYDANHAYLNLSINYAALGGLNTNQQNVGNALAGFFDRTGGIPLVFGALSPGGLTQVSGESATASQQTTFNAMTQFMNVMTDPFVAGRGVGMPASGTMSFAGEEPGVSAYASPGRSRSGSEREAYAAIYRKAPAVAETFAQRWNVWAAGYGGSQTTNGNAALGSNTATSRIYGTAVGADYRLSPNTLAGFALAGGGTSFAIANGLGGGRSDLFQAGVYLRHNVGPAYISAALAYGWQDITTDRIVTVAGVDQLRAKFNANAWSGRVESGYRFVAQQIGVTPYAAGQFTTFELPNYTETAVSGSDIFALTYGAKSVTASRSELGLRGDRSFALPDGVLTLRGRAAWAHDYNTDRNVSATFLTLPGASFVVNGASQARNAALATAAAEMKWLNGLSLAATFEGEFSNVTRSYAGKGVARYAW
jgi:autotransporter-associated beta strand protein